MKLIRFFRNKYFIAATAFVVWMLFFDHSNLFMHLDYRNSLQELKQRKQYYQKEIEKTKTEVELMKNNPRWMEKVAREQYLMKKDNEDIYLIPEK
jgi:cell division protein DivIC